MFTCQDCKHKSCLKTGKPCKHIEKLLPKVLHNKQEISFSNQKLDQINMKKYRVIDGRYVKNTFIDKSHNT